MRLKAYFRSQYLRMPYLLSLDKPCKNDSFSDLSQFFSIQFLHKSIMEGKNVMG